MSQKNIATVLILIATALGTPQVVNNATNDTPEPVIQLVGPSVAEIGQLITLKYDARRVEWKLPTEDSRVVSDGVVVLSFRTPGDYQVVASGIVGNAVQLLTHNIKINGQVSPEPEPEPVPESVPESELAQLVRDWCLEESAPKKTCSHLAGNFKVSAATSSTLKELMAKTADLNREIDQTGCEVVLAKVQAHLIKNLSGESLARHQQAWTEISEGLREYSKED